MIFRQLIVLFTVMLLVSIGFAPDATAKYRSIVTLSDSVLEEALTEPPVVLTKGGKRPKAQFKKAGKKSKPSTAKAKSKGRPVPRAKPKKADISVSNASRNLKALDKNAIHVARPFEHSLSSKERAQVRKRLDRLRNEVSTKRMH